MAKKGHQKFCGGKFVVMPMTKKKS